MAIVFSDNFNRANSDSLGGNWVEYAGDADISSNAMLSTSTATVYNTSSVGSANYSVTVNFDYDQGGGTKWTIPFCRGGTSGNPYDNAYLAYVQAPPGADFAMLLKRVSGGQSQLGSTNNTQYSGVHRIGCQANGTTISLSIDGTASINATDSSHSAEGYHGLRFDTDCIVDDYEIDDLTAGGGGGSLQVNIAGYTGVRVM